MKHKHLIDLNDYTKATWDKIVGLASLIKKNPHVYKGACTGKIMATLFYEPSTRTQMSFQSAMLRLGGGIIGFDNPEMSSVAKGESLHDTIKTISGYSDILVMRHYIEGAAKAAAYASDCPIINAGDGGHLHPTQTLTDLLTLTEEKQLNDNSALTVGICGDLLYGRTAHSLVRALSQYSGIRFVFISSEQLQMPAYIKEICSSYSEHDNLEAIIPELDVLYMTRIQRERFGEDEQGVAEYNKQKRIFTLDMPKLECAKSDLIIMHPLPRVDEIAAEVDADPRAAYFKQANYGMYVRMALILSILNGEIVTNANIMGTVSDVECSNLMCVTNYEPALPKRYNNGKCHYCESSLPSSDGRGAVITS